jgi:AraC family transcriptional regulator
MFNRIEIINEKKLVGRRMVMSLTDNKTRELWQGFMMYQKEIKNTVGSNLYSLQIFSPGHFEAFDPKREFVKWAAIEVDQVDELPKDMDTITIPQGLYAVFIHKGAAATGGETFRYIFGAWLPASEYTLDNRPHFEILGEKYKNDSPDSEEEIWIPVRMK